MEWFLIRRLRSTGPPPFACCCGSQTKNRPAGGTSRAIHIRFELVLLPANRAFDRIAILA